MGYDARDDALALAKPLRTWARMGFLRGFVGMRRDLGPSGRMVLPSTAFYEAAMAGLADPLPANAAEASARLAYVEEVEGMLQALQTSLVHEHYRKALHGRIVDIAVGFLSAVLVGLSWVELGIEHPVTVGILLILSAKAILIHIFIRRMVSGAMGAFLASASDVRLPWRQIAAEPT